MLRFALLGLCAALLAACVTTRQAPPAPAAAWEMRVGDLQKAAQWQLAGRAAVAVGDQGWQATLNWQQQEAATELRLSGPFGAGAVVLTTGTFLKAIMHTGEAKTRGGRAGDSERAGPATADGPATAAGRRRPIRASPRPAGNRVPASADRSALLFSFRLAMIVT